jgi:ribosomal protein S18 acetylase RimI-like enzyme
VEVRIEAADFEDAAQAAALVEIIDAYAGEAGGRNAPLTAEARAALAKGLLEHPSAFVLLAVAESGPLGSGRLRVGFSTFAGRPTLNVHDLAVLPAHRGRGIGQRLLEAVEAAGRAIGCCKITLEVREDNIPAQRLYRRCGFSGLDPRAGAARMWFLEKRL